MARRFPAGLYKALYNSSTRGMHYSLRTLESSGDQSLARDQPGRTRNSGTRYGSVLRNRHTVDEVPGEGGGESVGWCASGGPGCMDSIAARIFQPGKAVDTLAHGVHCCWSVLDVQVWNSVPSWSQRCRAPGNQVPWPLLQWSPMQEGLCSRNVPVTTSFCFTRRL